MLRTLIYFLTDDGDIREIDQDDYGAILRKERPCPDLAGKHIRVVDWYVDTAEAPGPNIKNETYSLLQFDASGYASIPGCHADEDSACPVDAEINNKPVEILRDSNIEPLWTPTLAEQSRLFELLSRAV
jgi:hypothetical protein